MKIRISLGLCAILGASFISVRAADTPVQAAARVALEQKMYELDHPQTLQPVPVTPSAAVAKPPGKSAAGVTRTVSTKAVTPPTAPAPTTPVAAPAAVAPAAVESAAVEPAAVAPAAVESAAVATAAVAPAMSPLKLSFLILSFLIPSLLLLKFLLRHYRGCGSNQDSTSSDTYNA